MTDKAPASAASATTPGPRLGLREKNKARTRAAIRAAALHLISTQGYAATTVAQIAEAAEVSHTTFFRYFQTKEHVMISDDLDDQRQQVLEDIPPGLDRFDLLRRIISDTVSVDAGDPWASNIDRIKLIRDEPVLRVAHQREVDRVVSELTGFIAGYLGVDVDDFRLRVFIAAVSGVMFHVAERVEVPDETVVGDLMSALDLLEHGLPV
ncbi:MAG: TetR family transcriptional regulator [Gordonia sp. (in: high G+C Gram-positive bacteria)]